MPPPPVSPAPAPVPAPTTPSPPPPAPPPEPQQPAVAAAPLPPHQAPITDEALVTEGSNYYRPLKQGFHTWGFIQAQYQHNQISQDQLGPNQTPLNENEFALRRARLHLDHGWEYVHANLELDASTINGFRVQPRRAEATLFYRLDDDVPLIALTGGITDLPFGAEIGESQRDRVFMERSVGSLAIFPTEADLGVKVWGAWKYFSYAVAMVNGQPLNDILPKDPNDAKDVVGRFGARARPLESLLVDGGISFYEGKGFSAGRDATKDSVIWVDDNNNGFAEPHEIQGVTGSAAVPSQNFSRWAVGLDLGASLRTPLGTSRVYGDVVVASNLDRGLLVSDPIASGSDVRQLVISVAAVQQVTRYAFAGFRAAYYDPNSDVFEERAGTFHIKDASFTVLSPSIGFTLPRGRVVAQYDFVTDHLARDTSGVPANAKNNQLTLRLQVDL